MLEWNPLTIAVVVLIVVYIIGSEVLKKYLDMKIEMFYTAEMYQEAIDLLDKIYTRILFSTFKQYYLRFTIYEADGNNKAAELMLEHLLNMRVSKKRRLALVLQAFNFYVMNGRRKDAQGMLDEIKSSGNQAVIADSQLTYDIVLGKRCDKIDQMEGMLQQATRRPAPSCICCLSTNTPTRATSATPPSTATSPKSSSRPIVFAGRRMAPSSRGGLVTG